MNKMIALIALVSLTGLVGCAGVYSAPVVPPTGWVFSDIAAPLSLDATDVSSNAKVGQAMTKNILGWVATGDASIEAAAKSAGITKIEQVDYHFKNILGVYSEFTTVVYGK